MGKKQKKPQNRTNENKIKDSPNRTELQSKESNEGWAVVVLFSSSVTTKYIKQKLAFLDWKKKNQFFKFKTLTGFFFKRIKNDKKKKKN